MGVEFSVPTALSIRQPEVMGRVLGIVYRVIATHLVTSAGFARDQAKAGAVTLIQRFGSALNLNVHFHILFLDGVYVERPDGRLRFRWVKAPTSAELTGLADTIARRVGRFLERQGLLESDAENSWLAGDGFDDDSMRNERSLDNVQNCGRPQCWAQGDDAADAASGRPSIW